MESTLLAEYLTPTQCAAELGIDKRTLERWHRLREAPPRTKIGKRVLYRREAVAKWLRSCEQIAEAV